MTLSHSTRAEFETHVRALVEKFSRNRAEYMAQAYSESQARLDFIDPFFEALGWDVRNRAHLSEHAREVVVERGPTSGRPDYNFRVGGRTVFYVEAKAPHVPLDQTSVILQAKRYAFGDTDQEVNFAAATDFEEFRFYDAHKKPDPRNPNDGLLFAYRYDEYLEPRALENLWQLSRFEIERGSLDKWLTPAARRERQRAPLDQQFLADLQKWRESLAKGIFRLNPALDAHDLNRATQILLDRLIFIRVAEDRGVLEYGQVREIAREWREERERPITTRLFALFRQVNRQLNGEIFKSPLPEQLKWDASLSKLLAEIILDGLEAYSFFKMPVELLGSIYERYLGKTLRIVGRSVKLEDKPEVRKAGGVYYTPKYVVDYIVEQTVGKLAEGKSAREIAKLKILDPACGSGSFLLGAYSKLLETHIALKTKERALDAAQPALLDDTALRETRLSFQDKAAILKNNLFGIDLDPQAVEITMMSLYIKLLEGERGLLTGQGVLPRLNENILCGNSLIGFDIGELSDAERERINPFDWHSKSTGFGEIMASGGFDAVIGNPPWGAEFSAHEQKYMREKYGVAQGSSLDSYSLFIESTLNHLKQNGLLGFITPDTFLRKDDHIHTRKILFGSTIRELIEAGPLFSQVRDTWCLIFTVEKSPPSQNALIHHRKISRFVVSPEERLEKFSNRDWDQNSQVHQQVWLENPKLIVGYFANEVAQKLIQKIEKNPPLGNLTEQFRISRGEEGSKFALQEDSSGDFWMVIPKDVERYFVEDGLRVSASGLTQTKVSALYRHPKIWIIRIQKMRWKQRVVCGFDARINSAGMKTLQVIVSPRDNTEDLKFLQAILASSLINFWCINYLADDMNQSYLGRIPIRVIDFANPADVARHDQMVKFVERMIELRKQKQTAANEAARERIAREIALTDEKIDALVYELYGLSDEEIALVEGRGR